MAERVETVRIYKIGEIHEPGDIAEEVKREVDIIWASANYPERLPFTREQLALAIMIGYRHGQNAGLKQGLRIIDLGTAE